MNRDKLYNIVEDKINEIFSEYQIANGIKTGDISPMQLLKLHDIENQLTDLIIEVGEDNKY